MAGELVVFPDIEEWVTDYIRTQLAGRAEPYAADVTVSTKVPDPRADRMVIFRRDGGARRSVASEVARLGIRVWGPMERDDEAVDLATLVRGLLHACAGEGPVRRVDDISGPSYIAEESGQPLRYLVVELLVRGTTL